MASPARAQPTLLDLHDILRFSLPGWLMPAEVSALRSACSSSWAAEQDWATDAWVVTDKPPPVWCKVHGILVLHAHVRDQHLADTLRSPACSGARSVVCMNSAGLLWQEDLLRALADSSVQTLATANMRLPESGSPAVVPWEQLLCQLRILLLPNCMLGAWTLQQLCPPEARRLLTGIPGTKLLSAANLQGVGPLHSQALDAGGMFQDLDGVVAAVCGSATQAISWCYEPAQALDTYQAACAQVGVQWLPITRVALAAHSVYYRRTELHVAAAAGCVRACDTLLRAGASPHLLDAGGQTPLMVAVTRCQDATVQALLSPVLTHRSTVLVRSAAWETPLELAAMRKLPDTVRMLQAAEADEQADPLVRLARRHELIGVRPGDVSRCLGCTPLAAAALHCHLPTLAALLEDPVSVLQLDVGNKFSQTPLHIAVVAAARWQLPLPPCCAGDCAEASRPCTDCCPVCFIQQLVATGCDIQAQDDSHHTALQVCCARLEQASKATQPGRARRRRPPPPGVTKQGSVLCERVAAILRAVSS